MKALPLLALVACTPLTGSGRARVLPAGQNEVALVPEVMLLRPELRETQVNLPSAQLALGYHRGIGGRFEAGARVWGLSLAPVGFKSRGGGLDAKLQLRSHDQGARFDLALAAAFGYHQIELGGTPQHLATATVPLLFGWKAGPRHEFIAGPRVAYWVTWGESQYPQQVPFFGFSTAFAWRIGARFTLLPELVVMWGPVPFGGEDPATTRTGLTLISVGIGGNFDW